MHVILPQNESTIVILSDFDRRDSEFVDGTVFAKAGENAGVLMDCR